MSQQFAFNPLTYTQVPDQLFDEVMVRLSLAELRTILYIIRRTFGFKQGHADAISIEQLLHGISRRDGTRLDWGTGLTKKTLLGALSSLVDKGYIVKERRAAARGGDLPSTYRLSVSLTAAQAEEGGGVVIPPPGVVMITPPPGGTSTPPPRGNEYTPGRGSDSPSQETVTQETGIKTTGVGTGSLDPVPTHHGPKISNPLPEELKEMVRYWSGQFGDLEHLQANYSQIDRLQYTKGYADRLVLEAAAIAGEETRRHKEPLAAPMAYFFTLLRDQLYLAQERENRARRRSLAGKYAHLVHGHEDEEMT